MVKLRDTAFAAQMARELLWERESNLSLADYVQVSQTFVVLYYNVDFNGGLTQDTTAWWISFVPLTRRSRTSRRCLQPTNVCLPRHVYLMQLLWA